MLRCPTLQTRSIYVEYEGRYSHLKNVTWPGQPFCFFLCTRPFYFLIYKTIWSGTLWAINQMTFIFYSQGHCRSILEWAYFYSLGLFYFPYIQDHLKFTYIQDHLKFTYIQDHFIQSNRNNELFRKKRNQNNAHLSAVKIKGGFEIKGGFRN